MKQRANLACQEFDVSVSVCVCVHAHSCVYTQRREEKRVLHIGQEVDLLQQRSDVSPPLMWKTVKIPIPDITHTHAHVTAVQIRCCCCAADRFTDSALCIHRPETIANSH